MQYRQGSRRQPIEYEKDLILDWKRNKTFEKSISARSDEESYVFYDGPPFITGVPHFGTLLTSIVKDAIPRYWTMKGKKVERRWGWDCHGLPAEVFTEKKLGIKDRRDIGTKISLEEYITTCRDNMIQTGSLWEDTIDRVGRWVNFSGAYRTMDKDYMESVWWAFKTLYDKGKIYEGEKVLMYCTRDATPISKAEVAMDNSYQDVTDPSVYVKFKLVGEDKYLLAWTTTPWTLITNSALAVNKDLQYTEVEIDDSRFIIGSALLEKVLTDEKHNLIEFKIIRELKGEELVGKSYEPIFQDYIDKMGENAFKIWHADFVHMEEGTGIAHESPAFGEDDYQLSKKNNFPWAISIDESGIYTTGEWKGKNIWDVNKEIAKALLGRGVVWKIEYITHSYPHCHRCGTKLIYKAVPSWFMDIDGQREEMLENNKSINWFPEHIKNGRFQNTVKSAPDWNLSRDRFWATAIPVWKGKSDDGTEHIKVFGSYKELEELTGESLEDYHRPWIDEITFEIDGIKYHRIDKVLDCWFESGCMPFAQYHYPFENTSKFEANFPGDFIVEYVPQVRAWFYYLHAVSTGLFEKKAFKNVIVHGTLAGNDGRKMSKNFGNYTDPNLLMDKYSADALRLLLLTSPVLAGEDYSLKDKDVSDISRKLSMVWNMFDFFTLYAEVDQWNWDGKTDDPLADLTNPLDRWIISKTHILGESMDEYMQEYDIANATKLLIPFIDEASNWYIRRNRKRFWKNANDNDKDNAYRTLHYVLVRISKYMAPFTPFLSEELFRKLTDQESVHLTNWPKTGSIDEEIVEDMDKVREVVSSALSKRAQAGIKARQPLSNLTIYDQQISKADYIEIMKEEVNVKEVIFLEPKSGNASELIELNTKITGPLKVEGLAREIVRHIQNARKNANLDVDDRILLSLNTDSAILKQAIEEYDDYIKAETLSTISNISIVKAEHTEEIAIEDHKLQLSLKRR